MKPFERAKILELRDRCIESLRLRNFSEQTIDHYKRDILCFVDFLCTKTEIKSIKGITKETIFRYQKHLQVKAHAKNPNATLSIQTQFNHLVILKKFMQWLEKENLIFRGISDHIELPKLSPSLPKAIMTQAELDKFFGRADKSTLIGYRNRAIMELLYSSALRVGELCYLKTQDMNTTYGEVKVLGKGKKERLVPVGLAACGFVRDYLLKIRNQLKSQYSGDFLFLSKAGKPLRRKDIEDFFRVYRNEAGIKKPVTPHSLRHQSATELHRNGADIRHIQKFLGHANLNTTQIYTKVDIEDLKRVHQKCHSREIQNSEAVAFEGIVERA